MQFKAFSPKSRSRSPVYNDPQFLEGRQPLSGKILEEYKDKIINLHPALLPKFGGVGMWGHHVHEAVLAAGEKESGCTIHLVSSECDGGKILIQKKVPVMSGDTPDSLYERIAPEEHKAIVEGLLLLCK